MARNDGCFHFAAAEGVGEDGAIGGTVVGHQQIQLTILGSMKQWKKTNDSNSNIPNWDELSILMWIK